MSAQRPASTSSTDSAATAFPLTLASIEQARPLAGEIAASVPDHGSLELGDPLTLPTFFDQLDEANRSGDTATRTMCEGQIRHMYASTLATWLKIMAAPDRDAQLAAVRSTSLQRAYGLKDEAAAATSSALRSAVAALPSATVTNTAASASSDVRAAPTSSGEATSHAGASAIKPISGSIRKPRRLRPAGMRALASASAHAVTQNAPRAPWGGFAVVANIEGVERPIVTSVPRIPETITAGIEALTLCSVIRTIPPSQWTTFMARLIVLMNDRLTAERQGSHAGSAPIAHLDSELVSLYPLAFPETRALLNPAQSELNAIQSASLAHACTAIESELTPWNDVGLQPSADETDMAPVAEVSRFCRVRTSPPRA